MRLHPIGTLIAEIVIALSTTVGSLALAAVS